MAPVGGVLDQAKTQPDGAAQDQPEQGAEDFQQVSFHGGWVRGWPGSGRPGAAGIPAQPEGAASHHTFNIGVSDCLSITMPA